jgi:hypothetical protein
MFVLVHHTPDGFHVELDRFGRFDDAIAELDVINHHYRRPMYVNKAAGAAELTIRSDGRTSVWEVYQA